MTPYTRRQSLLLPAIPLILSSGLAHARALDPGAATFKLPDQIPWGPVNPAGAQNAILTGDPAKEGLYIVMTKWNAGNHFSRPHLAMPAGTFVTHFGKQVHFDGAKTEDAVLLIVGEGPATATPAKAK